MLIRQSCEERAHFFQLLYAEFVTSAMKESTLFVVLWTRIGFNADPDPVFYLNADTDPDPGSQIPDPDQTFESQKVEFFRKNILEAGKRSKT
jgi:hypothetical protein